MDGTKATLQDLQSLFDEQMELWRSSTSRKALLDIINQHRPQKGGFNKVLCLGTGRFSEREVDYSSEMQGMPPGTNKRDMLQLASAVDVAAELGKGAQAGSVEVLAQEPRYQTQDLELLASQGVTVLKMDAGRKGLDVAMDHIGPRTLLFEFHISKDGYTADDFFGTEAGLYVCSPAKSFGTNMGRGWGAFHHGCDPDFGQNPPRSSRASTKAAACPTTRSFRAPLTVSLSIGRRTGNRMAAEARG